MTFSVTAMQILIAYLWIQAGAAVVLILTYAMEHKYGKALFFACDAALLIFCLLVR